MDLESGFARWSEARKELSECAAKAAALAKDKGKLSASERVARLLDEASFVEMDALNREAALIAGFGLIDGRAVYVVAHDYSHLAGSLGKDQVRKIQKVLDLAEKTGTPVLYLIDSGGVRLTDGVAVLSAYASLARSMSRLSGVVPQIAVVLGPCVAGAALLAASADVMIVSEKAGAVLAFPPQVFSSVEGKTLTLTDVGGGKQAAATGIAQLTAASEEDAIALARAVIGYLPGNSSEDAPFESDADDFNRMILELDTGKDADIRDTLRRIADGSIILEFSPAYCGNVVTALAHLGGRSVGFVANASEDGKMCVGACDKAARFVSMCDGFNIPIVTLIDCAGMWTVPAKMNADMIKSGARIVSAFASATVPQISVITGRAIGTGYVLMGGKGLGSDVTFAWPDAVIAPMLPEAMAQIFSADELSAQDPLGSKEKLALKYVAEAGDALYAAKNGFVDDVIAPSQTRQQLIAALEMLIGKSVALPMRKHGNLPL